METIIFIMLVIAKIFCLNRTMQYGNSSLMFFSFSCVDCLNRTMQYGNDSIHMHFMLAVKFKSYYVVWKHRYIYARIFQNERLNRTMQYGNCCATLKPARRKKGLNRTMQYGNGFFATKRASAVPFKSYYVVWKQPNTLLRYY